jgi:hypothetical protein
VFAIAADPTEQDLFFRDAVRRYTQNPRLLDRPWLVAELDLRLRDPGSRFVLLTAAPGIGKSVFAAQLAARNPQWPVYFIRRDQQRPLSDVSAKSFLLRIGYQLAALHPEVFDQEAVRVSVAQRIGETDGAIVGAEVKRIVALPFHQKTLEIQQDVERNKGRVVGLRLEELVIEVWRLEVADLQKMALIDPAQALLRLHPKNQIVVLVDGLDEIRYHTTSETVVDWLTHCPQLPPNVRFVLTSRPDAALEFFCEKQAPHVSVIRLEPQHKGLLNDVRHLPEASTMRVNDGATMWLTNSLGVWRVVHFVFRRLLVSRTADSARSPRRKERCRWSPSRPAIRGH